MQQTKELHERKVLIDGKRVSIYYRSDREFQRKYKEKLLEAERTREEERNITLAKVADAWQTSHDLTLQHYTRECYKAPLADVLSWFGPRKFSEIRPRDLQDRLDAMYRQGYARQTIKLRKIVLSMIYDYAVLNGYVTANPVPSLTIPRGAPTTPRELPPSDALRNIFSNIGQPLGMYFLLAACTGGRRGEILALTKADVDFDHDIIIFNKVLILSNNSKPEIRAGTKSKAGNRSVPILPALRPILLEYVASLPGDALFTAPCGELYTKSRFDKQAARYRKLTGTDFTAHQLRHLYATLCLDAGLDAKDAQQLLGHSKASTTMDIYVHIRESRRAQTDSRLSEALNAALTAEAGQKKQSVS